MSKKMYLITGDCDWQRQIRILKKLMPLGIDFLQYRKKSSDLKTMRNEAAQLKVLCQLYGTKFIVNDYLDLAMEVGADGIHLGQSDGALSDLPSYMKKEFIVGSTAKSVEIAKESAYQDADYLGVGAFYPSKTKSDALPMTLETLKEIRKVIRIPMFAIGGLSSATISAEISEYVDGYAFSNAIWAAENPEKEFLKIKSFE